jgi:prophage regulatory protein
MRDILMRLRTDAGQMTLGALIQEREAAALEIEQLRGQFRQRDPSELPPTPSRAKAVTRPDPSVEPRAFHANAFLRLSEVCDLVAVSRSTIYKRISNGSFPCPVRILQRSVRWRFEDVANWIRDPQGN